MSEISTTVDHRWSLMELFVVSHFLYQSYTTAPVLALRIILDRRFWGVEETGISVDLFQVPETLSLDALKALSAAQKPADVMVLDRSFLTQLSFGPASCQNGLAFQTWWNANPFWHDASPNESLLWWHRWAGWPRNHPLHGPDTVGAPWHGLRSPRIAGRRWRSIWPVRDPWNLAMGCQHFGRCWWEQTAQSTGAEVCLEARPSPWQCCEEDCGPSSKPQVQSGGDLLQHVPWHQVLKEDRMFDIRDIIGPLRLCLE